MSNRRSLRWLCASFGFVTTAAFAGNPFSGETTTAGGYPTWDSDLINVESVPQTGKGVYVAVLDTGLVPNWRDYFPGARVATHLGAGFHQPVTFKAGNLDPCGLDVAVGKLQQSTWVGSRGSSTVRTSPARSSATSMTRTSIPSPAFRCRRSWCAGSPPT